MARRKVRVVREDGSWVYNRLWDDGSDVLRFDSYGFVTRSWLDGQAGMRLVEGWA